MKLPVKKTMLMIDENNYLIYINHSLLVEKGKEYPRERLYLKKLVEDYWKEFHSNPDSLNNVEDIKTIKTVFGLKNLEIV